MVCPTLHFPFILFPYSPPGRRILVYRLALIPPGLGWTSQVALPRWWPQTGPGKQFPATTSILLKVSFNDRLSIRRITLRWPLFHGEQREFTCRLNCRSYRAILWAWFEKYLISGGKVFVEGGLFAFTKGTQKAVFPSRFGIQPTLPHRLKARLRSRFCEFPSQESISTLQTSMRKFTHRRF